MKTKIFQGNRQYYMYKQHEGKVIKTDGRKLLLDALKLIGISGMSGIIGVFQLGPDCTEVQYIYRHSREERL
jgi:hypothetical protein